MDGVFWRNEIGFVVDKLKLESSFPGGSKFGPISINAALVSSQNLPILGNAPLASWMLARLMHVTREGIGFERNAKIFNDGGGFHVQFIAFTRKLSPLAFLNIHGTSGDCTCWGQCAQSFFPNELVNTLVDVLLEDVYGLMPCKVLYYDTDPPHLGEQRIGKPRVLGWDGSKFLGVTEFGTA